MCETKEAREARILVENDAIRNGKFWMIYVEGGSSPSHKHFTLEEAQIEAERLARATKQLVFILQPSAILQVEPAPVKVTTLNQ